MGIVNRRNAFLGWGVWKIAKRFGKQKAKAAVPGTGDHAGLNKGAIASVVAAVGGARRARAVCARAEPLSRRRRLPAENRACGETRRALRGGRDRLRRRRTH